MSANPRQAGRHRAQGRRTTSMEALEGRRLLAQVSLSPTTGILGISGNFQADSVLVSHISGGSIRVRVEVEGSAQEYDFRATSISRISFVGRDGDDVFRNETGIPATALGGNGNDTLVGGSGHDQLMGERGDDRLLGREGNDTIEGGAGRDRLEGGGGKDVLHGSADDDTIYGGDDNDQLYGGEGNDTIDGGGGNDVLRGYDGNDILYGGGGNDEILGMRGNDQLIGGSGNDMLDGGSENDDLRGGAGNDVLEGAADDDVLLGGDGNDVLRGGVGNDLLMGDAGDDQLLAFDGDDYLYGGNGDDILEGARGNDRLYGDAGDDTLIGGSDNDWLEGDDGDDVLDGGTGNDSLYGGDGHDVGQGGAGDDYVYGGDGSDTLTGFEGNDLIDGGVGDDSLDGGPGFDMLHGHAGNDQLLGGSDDDMLVGGSGNDLLDGGTGDDVLHADAGNDILQGGVGDDDLYGGDGDDLLHGFEGVDSLLGGKGRDTLDAGPGNDILVGHDGNDSLDGGADDDLLIGGADADTIHGRGGGDLLIGGATKYDYNDASLRQIRELWASPLDYDARILALQDPLFTAYLFSDDTVYDDAVADYLTGDIGRDWFFLTGSLRPYIPAAARQAEQSGARHHDEATPVDAPPPLEGFDFIDSLDELLDVGGDEQIHTIVPHADDPSKMSEHLAIFELIRYDRVTHTAVAGGAWTSPNTWQNGRVPSAGANVLIPSGVQVTVDAAVAAKLQSVRVDGMLRFDPKKDTELRVDTLVVTPGGTFEMGTQKNPIEADVEARLVIADTGPVDRSGDPFGLGRGLINHGLMTVYGAAKSSHASLSISPRTGSNLLLLSETPTGWRIGDRIVIPGMDGRGAEDEVREIRGVNGRFVWIDPLQYDHVAPDRTLPEHVANLTRNAVFESENAALDRRGHVMFMHTRNVNVNNGGFYHLGRSNKLELVDDPVVDANWQLKEGTGTNPRGRYAVHFHRNGVVDNGKPAVVRGSAVEDSPGWGYVNHSSFVEFVDNVAYDVDGAAFVTEAGDEIGAFRDNIAIHSVGSGEDVNSREWHNDFGHQGDGFWLQGAGVAVTGNIAAGHTGHAYIVYARGLNHGKIDQQEFVSANLADPSLASGRSTIDVQHVPMREFSDNIGYASSVGLTLRYHLRDAEHDTESQFEDSSFWNNTTGVELLYTHNVVLRDLKVIRQVSLEEGTGVDSNLVSRDVKFENLTVTGYWRGIDVPRSGATVVEGGTYNNLQNIVVRMPVESGRTVRVAGDIEFGSFPTDSLRGQSQYEVFLRPHIEFGGLDTSRAFLNSSVTLDYGRFTNADAYFHTQSDTYVPFPSTMAGIPSSYEGLTNGELWSRHHVAVGGGLAPDAAKETPGVFGLVVD